MQTLPVPRGVRETYEALKRQGKKSKNQTRMLYLPGASMKLDIIS